MEARESEVERQKDLDLRRERSFELKVRTWDVVELPFVVVLKAFDDQEDEAERRIEVEWADATAELTYRTRLIIYAVDRPGILNELTGIVSGENVNIASIETRETNKPEQLAIIELTMELEDVSQFDRIVAAMRRLRDVREVTRSHRN